MANATKNPAAPGVSKALPIVGGTPGAARVHQAGSAPITTPAAPMPLSRRPLLRRKRSPEVDRIRPIGLGIYLPSAEEAYMEGFSTPT